MSIKDPQYDIFYPPANGDNDDPRPHIFVAVDDLLVDETIQRPTDDDKFAKFSPWDWDKAEDLTVSIRDDGVIVAVEGQHRVLERQRRYPGSHMWAAVTTRDADEARVALGIAKGRRPHSAYAKFRLAVASGDRYAIAAQITLDEQGLHLEEKLSSADTVNAVTEVLHIMHTFDQVCEEDEAIRNGARLLGDTISNLRMAWAERGPQRNQWHRALLGAVAHLLAHHPGLRQDRLTRVLARDLPDEWVNMADVRRSRRTKAEIIGRQIAEDYNKNLSEDHKIQW